MFGKYEDRLVLALIFILSVSITFNIFRWPFTGAQGKQIQGGDHHCETKLRVLGYRISREAGNSENDKPDEKGFADLCQQIRMAEAAEQTSAYELSGVIAAWLSLVAVIAATLFAGAAAIYAKRAATSGKDAVEEARKNGQLGGISTSASPSS